MAPKIVVLNVELQPAGGKKLLKGFFIREVLVPDLHGNNNKSKVVLGTEMGRISAEKIEVLLEWLQKLLC